MDDLNSSLDILALIGNQKISEKDYSENTYLDYSDFEKEILMSSDRNRLFDCLNVIKNYKTIIESESWGKGTVAENMLYLKQLTTYFGLNDYIHYIDIPDDIDINLDQNDREIRAYGRTIIKVDNIMQSPMGQEYLNTMQLQMPEENNYCDYEIVNI